jgi:hypothetical protein
VSGTTNTAVSWSIVESCNSTIDSTGNFLADITDAFAVLTLMAVSQADPSKSATATIRLTNLLPLTGTLAITGCCPAGSGVDEWVNAELTASYTPGGTNSGSGAASFKWQRNGGDIPGASGASYTVSDDDRLAGAVITASVQFSNASAQVSSSNSFAIRDLTGIYNEAQLAAIRTPAANLAKNYILALAGAPALALTNPNWTPIGAAGATARFTGSFDGNGKTISGLTITGAATYRGLFGYIDTGSVVKSISFANVNISGGQYTAVVAGYSGGTIENCSVTSGSVYSSTSMMIGGIAGSSTGLVQGCSTAINVSGGSRTGGIVGNAAAGTQVINCNTSGNINSSSNLGAGGIVGYSSSTTTQIIIQNCHATGNISGTGYVGGVVGGGTAGTTVQNCTHSAGTVTGGGNNGSVGGIIGYASSNTSIINCSSSTPLVSGARDVGGILGEGFAALVTLDNCHYTGGTVEADSSVTTSVGRAGGVVGRAQSSPVIRNCTATGTVTSTGNGVGGIGGDVTGTAAIIEYCNFTGTINGVDNAGGVIGSKAGSGTAIKYCYANAVINSTGRHVGGIGGYFSTEVQNCYFAGSVSGTTRVGGIIGYSGLNGIITNCYSTANVTGSSTTVGGLIGTSFYSSTIEKCYYSGTVTGDINIGGIVPAGSVSNSAVISPSITALSSTILIGRLRASGAAGLNNYARADLVPESPSGVPVNISGTSTAAQKDGANIASGPGGYNGQAFWETTLGWDFSVSGAWEWSTAKQLPILRGLGGQ